MNANRTDTLWCWMIEVMAYLLDRSADAAIVMRPLFYAAFLLMSAAVLLFMLLVAPIWLPYSAIASVLADQRYRRAAQRQGLILGWPQGFEHEVIE